MGGSIAGTACRYRFGTYIRCVGAESRPRDTVSEGGLSEAKRAAKDKTRFFDPDGLTERTVRIFARLKNVRFENGGYLSG